MFYLFATFSQKAESLTAYMLKTTTLLFNLILFRVLVSSRD